MTGAQAEVVVRCGAAVVARACLGAGQRLVLGRSVESDVQVPDGRASRKHVSLEWTPQGLVATDLGSVNGTALDGAPLPAFGSRPLRPQGSTLRIGDHEIDVRPLGGDGADRQVSAGWGAASVSGPSGFVPASAPGGVGEAPTARFAPAPEGRSASGPPPASAFGPPPASGFGPPPTSGFGPGAKGAGYAPGFTPATTPGGAPAAASGRAPPAAPPPSRPLQRPPLARPGPGETASPGSSPPAPPPSRPTHVPQARASGTGAGAGAVTGAPGVAGNTGRIRDDFERLGELGRGGAGTVFRARHRATGREVAVKALVDKVSDEPTARERFLRESRVRVESPHVVQTLDVRVEQGQVYLVLELCPGGSLEERLRLGALPIAQSLQIGEQIALALAAAHEAGVVHRDVKPANVLFASDGAAKLGDFGIAKVLQGERSLTATGTGMGTLLYVAPEQAEDAKRVSPAADLYALGATLYHMLAGKPPFPPGPDLIRAIFEDDPPPLARARPDCPAEVARLVHRLLEKDPDDRPPSARVVAGKLRTGR